MFVAHLRQKSNTSLISSLRNSRLQLLRQLHCVVPAGLRLVVLHPKRVIYDKDDTQGEKQNPFFHVCRCILPVSNSLLWQLEALNITTPRYNLPFSRHTVPITTLPTESLFQYSSPAQIRTGVKGSKGPYAWPLHSAENWIFSSTGLPGVTSPIMCVFIILRRLWRLSSCLWGPPWLPLFYRPFSSGPSGTGRQRSFSWPPRQAF